MPRSAVNPLIGLRQRTIVAVAVGFLCLCIPAHALTISDPAGDSSVGGINDVARGDATDILEITLEESHDAFMVSFLMASATAPTAPLADTVDYFFSFSHRDQRYEVRAFQEAEIEGGMVVHEVGATLRTVDEFGAARAIAELNTTIEGDVVKVDVPRELLVDSAGAAPFPGRLLHDLVGEAQFRETTAAGNNGDRAPDNGFWREDFLVTLGGAASNGLRMSSTEPFRLSNGEATTFLYSAALTNDLDEAIEYVLEAQHAPDAWDIRIPSPTGTLDALETIVVPIAVRLPFAHSHGKQQAFTLAATGVEDSSIQAEVQLGVTFTAIAQPTGHHPTIYLHAGAPNSDRANDTLGPLAPPRPYINAEPDDDRDTGVDLGSGISRAPLDPMLGVGLQLEDLTTLGTVPVQGSNHDITGLSATGFIEYRHANGTHEELFTFTSTTSINLAANAAGEIGVEVQKVIEAARLPYQKGAQLLLSLFLEWDAPQVDGPSIRPGAAITLPLAEYHDLISEQFTSITKVALTIPEPQRTANPGGLIVVPWHVENQGDTQIELVAKVTGLNSDWTAVHLDQSSIGAGQVREGVLRVQVPESAIAGERADLLLEVYAPDLVAIGRAVIEVVTDVEVPSDPDIQARPEKESPGAPVVVIACLLGVGVVMYRRR